jgi:hypothetical protein
VNDAVGGATSGTLNLTQTAIGGNGGGLPFSFHANAGGTAGSTLNGTNPYGASTYNLTANATGGNGSFGGGAAATADASGSKSGVANATANAIGGAAFSGDQGTGGAATANASATNGGSAVAQATGGNSDTIFGLPGGAATANASATNGGSAVAQATGGGTNFTSAGTATANASSTAMLGGTANATATATGGNIFNGVAPNANSFAATINGNTAQAVSSAVGGCCTFISFPPNRGQAQATAQTNFGNFQSVQSTSTSPVSGTSIPASAIAQGGGVVSLSNAIIPGQSFSVVSGSGFGPLTVANGSMGAGYGGTLVKR